MNWQTALLFWGIMLACAALVLAVTVATLALGAWVVAVFAVTLTVGGGLFLGLVTR